ncbi:MAG TPA: DUF1579 family protein [Thermoanaerobaculia bacterium]|jgi:hypothetical protein|nr:DUF1579 family protein [Thermoanaerobaculia bacterium]
MKARILFVALVLIASTVLAADKRNPNLANLDYFAGKWNCTGTDLSSGKPMATTSTANGRWDYANQWLVVDLNQTKPAAMKASAFLGYDAGPKQYVVGYLDSMGGYGTSGSSGWVGDTITYDGDAHMMGMSMKGRDWFKKWGANKFQHVFEVEQKGSWNKMLDETCTKK